MSDEPDDLDPVDAAAPAEAESVNDDAGSQKGLRRKRDRIDQEQREARDVWSAFFATPAGRREAWGLLQAAHTFEERFAVGPSGVPQPEATWFHAGEQSFGLRLYQSWMRTNRAEVFLMHDENDPEFVKAKK